MYAPPSDLRPSTELRPDVQHAVESFVGGFTSKGQLLPGAAEELLSRVRGTHFRDPSDAVQHVADFLRGPGQRLFDPERAPDDSENLPPLKKAINSMPTLTNAQKETLYQATAVRMSHLPETVLYKELWSLLCHDNRVGDLLGLPQEPTPQERQAERAVNDHLPALEYMKSFFRPGTDLRALAVKWSSMLAVRFDFASKLEAICERMNREPNLSRDGKLVPTGQILFDYRARERYERQQAQEAARREQSAGPNRPPQQQLQQAQPMSAEEVNRMHMRKSGLGV